jgi:ketosteroid isomerase-like protein
LTSSVDIVKTAYDSFAAGDMEGAVSVMSPDVEWIELFPFAGTYHGADAIRELFVKVADTHDDYDMTFDEWIVDDDRVVVVGNYRVHRKGADEYFESRFVHVFWVQGGKIVKYEQITDTGQAAKLGGRGDA